MARKKKDTGSTDDFSVIAKELIEKDLPDYVNEIYAPYAWSVCLDRALVYITDGLKPIQRKILWTAKKLGITDKSARMKSATFEGRVMKYSPHGGCILGDTNMYSLEHGVIKISDLAKMFSSGEVKKIYTISINSNGEPVIGEINNAWVTKYVDEYYEVELSTGDKLRLTGNHELMLSNGDFIATEDLLVGGELKRISIVNQYGNQETHAIVCDNGAKSITIKDVGNGVHTLERDRKFETSYEEFQAAVVSTTKIKCNNVPVYDFSELTNHNSLLLFDEFTNCNNVSQINAICAHNSYDVVVNMAETESEGIEKIPRPLRLPLIEGKGNFGGINRNLQPAAASRYSEIRLTPAAMELINELDENTVEFVPNYDNTDVEPVFLPARWPVALINGVPDAMAVGYACNIPNHNPDEVMNACIALEKNPKLSSKELKKIILGPDFNCGCDIIAMRERDGVVQDGIASYMETGSGTFTMRGKYTVEEVNGRNIIKFYSLPYKVDPADVIEDIKREYEKGGFRELSEWKNLSDLEHPVLLYLETKKGINLPKLISDLYSKTKLECAFSANNTIISGEGVEARPVKLGVKDIILGFLNFRHQCTRNKLNNRIKLKEAELSKNNAIKAVSVDIDKCISIIRKANDRSEAAKKLEKAFKINEEQSKYVLSLQIGSLTKSDTIAIQKKIEELEKSLKETKEILADPKKFSKFIISELEETKKNISSPRKCKIIKSLEEEEEVKDIFLGINSDGKIYRTFKESEDVYNVNKDGKVVVITESKAFIRSIYELNDEKLSAISKLKFPGKGLAVAANSGYLLIVGEEGSAKIVDMSSYNYPNKDTVDGIFKQKVVYATVIRDLTGKIVINGSKKIKISDIPVQSMTAKNGKKISRENIISVELVQ